MKKIAALTLFIIAFSVYIFAEFPVVTVLDFQMNSVSESDMKSITSFLSASLYDTGVYRVIDTAQRDTILEELAFSNTGCTDESCQLEIGKLLSAEFIVTGDVAYVDGRYMLSARMLETETSSTVNTGKGIYPGLGELIDDMPLFAAKLSGDEKAILMGKAEVEKAAAEKVKADAVVKEPVSGRKIAAWSTLGGGAIAAGAGGYLLYSAFNYKTSTVDPAYDAYNTAKLDTNPTEAAEYYDVLWDGYESKYDDFNSKLLVSSIIAGAGIASIITSVLLFNTDIPNKAGGRDSAPADTAFLFIPGINAATLAYSIRM